MSALAFALVPDDVCGVCGCLLHPHEIDVCGPCREIGEVLADRARFTADDVEAFANEVSNVD